MQIHTIGFVGGGAMAEAIIAGVLQAGLLAPERVYVADHKRERCAYLEDTYGVHACQDACEFAGKADFLVLAVKPQVAEAAMRQIEKAVRADAVIVSIVAGLSIAKLEAQFPAQAVVRVMPNTPVAVGEGMSAVALGTRATVEIGDAVEALFAACGKALVVLEKAIEGVTGLSGSGPGYAFVIIDALADAGVKVGLPRKTAITLAAQTLLGAAKMVLETGKHPAELRDMVTSPGGTTIAGIHAMERRAVRAALIEAVEASVEQSKVLG